MISLAAWIVWLHLLAMAAWLGGGAAQLLAVLPSVKTDPAMVGPARRIQFLTSRAMEAVILTGILNFVLRGLASHWVFSRGFVAMLSLKVILVIVMAVLHFWMGLAWKSGSGGATVALQRARLALPTQLVVGAVAALLGLGLRSV